jgi:thioester reductase-like protein
MCFNRSDDGEQRTLSALQKIDGSNSLARIQFLITDITKPGFGLDAHHHHIFVSEVDEVVFNAWNPNWGLPLKSFEPLIASVDNVIELRAERARGARESPSCCPLALSASGHANIPNSL